MPAPCTARHTTSQPMLGASALNTLEATYSDSPHSSTGRRP